MARCAAHPLRYPRPQDHICERPQRPVGSGQQGHDRDHVRPDGGKHRDRAHLTLQRRDENMDGHSSRGQVVLPAHALLCEDGRRGGHACDCDARVPAPLSGLAACLDGPMIRQPPLVPPLVTCGCRSLDSCLFVLSGACRAVCRLRAPGRISAAVPCVFVTTLGREQHVVRVCMYCAYLIL